MARYELDPWEGGKLKGTSPPQAETFLGGTTQPDDGVVPFPSHAAERERERETQKRETQRERER